MAIDKNSKMAGKEMQGAVYDGSGITKNHGPGDNMQVDKNSKMAGKEMMGAVYDGSGITKNHGPGDNMRMEGRMETETTTSGYKPSPMEPHRNVRRNANESKKEENN